MQNKLPNEMTVKKLFFLLKSFLYVKIVKNCLKKYSQKTDFCFVIFFSMTIFFLLVLQNFV